MAHITELGLYLIVGFAGGLVGSRLRFTGGALIGAMAAVIIVKIISGKEWMLPGWYPQLVQILLGIVIGASYTVETAHLLKRIAFPVIGSTLVLVITGFLISLVMVKWGFLDGPTAYLSTSPGAMSALLSIAGEKCTNPPIVLVFHFFRIVFIIITAPIVFYILQKMLGTSGGTPS